MTTFRENRFNRKMREREQELRYSEQVIASIDSQDNVIPIPKKIHRNVWECHFCRREFYSFPALLNHKCDDQD